MANRRVPPEAVGHILLDGSGALTCQVPTRVRAPGRIDNLYAVAISLAGPIFAWRIAFRLTYADPARRYAAYGAGLFAAGLVLLMQDPLLPANYLHYLLSAESDTIIVALCLAAIDCHLSGRHKWAFWIWWLGSLGRPEVWPFCGLAGIWLWRAASEYRRWLIGALVVQLFFWLGIPGLTSKSVFTAGKLWNFSPPRSLNIDGRSRGLGIRMLHPPMRIASIMFVLKPKM